MGVQESGSPFASPVTIPLALKDSGGNDITSLDLSSGGSANTSGGVATYSPLDVERGRDRRHADGRSIAEFNDFDLLQQQPVRCRL